jgi:hypothetical protein
MEKTESMASELPIGGFNLSEALVQVNLQASAGHSLLNVIERLSHGHINLVYMTMAVGENGWRCALAVAIAAWPAAQPLIAESDGLLEYKTIAPVGTITVFPHQSRLALLETILESFAQAGLIVYNVASSLSCLTFATDYHQLPEARRILLGRVRLAGEPDAGYPAGSIRQR